MTHINKEYGVDLDVEVSLPKLKGNFKGSHSPSFQCGKAKVIPMSEEESVEDLFRSLAQKKSSPAAQEEGPAETSGKKNKAAAAAAIYDPNATVLSGFMEKEGRGRFSTWNKR